MSAETRVGLLTIAALGALAWLSLNSGLLNNSINGNYRPLESAFSNVEGLFIGADVKIAGVNVGSVTDITLQSDGMAVVHFNVKDDVDLNQNVQAKIDTSGLIGEKYLALVAPQGLGMTELAEDARRIPSAGSSAPEDITNNFANASSDLLEITKSLRAALGGAENARKLSSIVDSFEGFSARLDFLLNQELKDGDISTIVGNVKAATNSLRTMLESPEGDAKNMMQNFSTTAKNLADITTRLERGEGLLGQMMTKDGVETGNLMTDLKAAAANIKEVSAKLNGGEGTLGKLISDETMGKKVEEAVTILADSAKRIDSFRTNVDLGYYGLMAEHGIGKGYANVTLRPNDKRYYVLGATSDGFANAQNSKDTVNPYRNHEFGNDVKFTAQFGHVFQSALLGGQNFGLRIGLKDSTGGIGLDTQYKLPFTTPDYLNDSVDIEADIYDFSGENSDSIDAPHLDLKFKYGFNVLDHKLYGTIGYDNILNQEYGSPIIGVGFRFQDDDIKYALGKAL